MLMFVLLIPAQYHEKSCIAFEQMASILIELFLSKNEPFGAQPENPAVIFPHPLS
jgi:hypothetical protein